MKEQKIPVIGQVVIFGLSSVVVLAVTWLRPMSGIDRALSTLIGCIGILVSLIKMRQLRMATTGSA